MQRHFHEELEALKQTLLAMGGLVEDQIRRVMRALLERDGVLAQEVIDRDARVNAYDVEIDEKCVELLALHQPAAGDLRFITTAMKIVTDLERIGDQAVNIAQRSLELYKTARATALPSWSTPSDRQSGRPATLPSPLRPHPRRRAPSLRHPPRPRRRAAGAAGPGPARRGGRDPRSRRARAGAAG